MTILNDFPIMLGMEKSSELTSCHIFHGGCFTTNRILNTHKYRTPLEYRCNTKTRVFYWILQGEDISSPGPAKSGSPRNGLCPIRLYHIIVSSTLIGNQFKIACIRAGHKLFQNETFITMNATHSSQLMSQTVRSLSSVSVQKKSSPGSFGIANAFPVIPPEQPVQVGHICCGFPRRQTSLVCFRGWVKPLLVALIGFASKVYLVKPQSFPYAPFMEYLPTFALEITQFCR